MADTVRDVMTTDPLSLSLDEPLTSAARQMRDADVGAVLVTEGDSVRGLVTDRDIVVRAVADEMDPRTTTLGSICTHDLVSVGLDDSVDRAVQLMREYAVRRLPVLDGGRPVGIVALGDLAVERDSDSALAEISTADPNN
jgi:CBS domain-containing protein